MGKRGPPKKPTALKMLANNPGKRPVNEAEPEFIGGKVDPPAHLDGEALTEWLRVCKELEVNGLLSQMDRAACAAYCQAYGRWVQAEMILRTMREASATSEDRIVKASQGLMIRGSTGNAVQNPLIRIASDAMDAMLKAAKEFGMTPAARAGVSGQKEPDKNPFDDFKTATHQAQSTARN